MSRYNGASYKLKGHSQLPPPTSSREPWGPEGREIARVENDTYHNSTMDPDAIRTRLTTY